MEKIAVIGATGNVGRKVVQMLINSTVAREMNIDLFASHRSAGQYLQFAEQQMLVNDLKDINFQNYRICVFNTEADISSGFIPKALAGGAYVVDSSSYYRLNPKVPLIIPPVNKELVKLSDSKLYAHANCLASPIATVLAPLHKLYPIKRIIAVTYQSTSGAGKLAHDECIDETKSILNNTHYQRTCFSKQIAFNVIPQVGVIDESGYSSEENKIIAEIKKVVDNLIEITVTAVRVPVLIGHSIVLNVEFNQEVSLADINQELMVAEAVKLSDNDYLTPAEVVGRDEVFVGRLREDNSSKKAINMWLCSDNLRRGAATDSVEILKAIVAKISNKNRLCKMAISYK